MALNCFPIVICRANSNETTNYNFQQFIWPIYESSNKNAYANVNTYVSFIVKPV